MKRRQGRVAGAYRPYGLRGTKEERLWSSNLARADGSNEAAMRLGGTLIALLERLRAFRNQNSPN